MSSARARRNQKSSRTQRELAPSGPISPQNRALRTVTLALAAICLIGLFSTEIADSDFWWHLKTGQYIVQHYSLPVPDPFAYTTSLQPPAYAGEDAVRHFNLTHEWLAQALLYLVYIAGGFPAIVFVRATLLGGVCALAGLLAARFSDRFEIGILAAFATAFIAVEFRADRPALVTFLCLALFTTLLELRRVLWLLPPLAWLWSNCHGGFFLGWVVLVAYCVETNLQDRRRIWLVTACSIAISGLNPNGFGVLSTILKYRQSEMTANLLEWQRPSLWGPPYALDILLYAAALVLVFSWRRVRMAHWVLFAAFTAASLLAFRNVLFVGFLAPVLIAAYFPVRLRVPAVFAWAIPPLLAAALVTSIAGGSFFQLRAAAWTTPTKAADFLLTNRVTGQLFNTYEQGGFLIWKLWPQQRVFIDGRALSETAYRDYRQILFNRGSSADEISGPRADLLKRYDVQVMIINTLDSVSGALYPLALALGNPTNSDWQLVYDDPQDLIFLRHPPTGMPVFPDKLRRALNHLDTECAAYIEHSPDTPACARTLADYWLRNGVNDRARRMLVLYLSHSPHRDAQAERALQQLGPS